MTARAHLMIHGRVQGVGFRYFVSRKARALGVKGWVRNTEGGDVEAVLEGTKAQLSDMIEDCRGGPAMARVTNVEVIWDETPEGFESFAVRD